MRMGKAFTLTHRERVSLQACTGTVNRHCVISPGPHRDGEPSLCYSLDSPVVLGLIIALRQSHGLAVLGQEQPDACEVTTGKHRGVGLRVDRLFLVNESVDHVFPPIMIVGTIPRLNRSFHAREWAAVMRKEICGDLTGPSHHRENGRAAP